MNFHIHCELDYTLFSPASFLFALRCMETTGQCLVRESLVFDPFVEVEDFHIENGLNRLSRINTTGAGPLKVFYDAEVRASYRTVPVVSLGTDGPGDLKPTAIPFLFPSRYCQSDRLRQQAQDLFGHLQTSHEVAAAVSDWIFENIAYVAGSSGESCSAIETATQRQGVCRDFAHLGIAFCRAMNVPARYTTCYAYQLNPEDFHACFEVLIGDTWHVFDPTRLAPLNGLVRIATGRDAGDTAICTIFGNPELTRSFVTCGCDNAGFIPLIRDDLAARDEAVVLL